MFPKARRANGVFHGCAVKSRLFTQSSGFTLIETLAALAIAAMLLMGLTSLMSTASGNARAQQAALYQAQVSSSAMQLIKANYQSLLTAPMTTTTPLVISLTGSKPAGYKLGDFLPTSLLPRNAFQQQPCLLVYRGTGTGWTGGVGPQDILAFLVTEGGQTIDDRTLGYIEANAGAGAGAIQSISGGKAQGAFGSWSAPLTIVNQANASCSGTVTGVGHLVSQLYYSGGNGAAGDFLYRQPESVTGVADGNTMHAPIVLADQAHTDRDATDPSCQTAQDLGKVTADSAGNLLNCMKSGSGIAWSLQGSMHWRAPVVNYSDLANIVNPAPEVGDVVLVSSLARAFAWTGTVWQSLAVDQNGDLTVPGLLNLNNQQVLGGACSDASASSTSVSTDAQGHLLSCQGNVWRTPSAVTGSYVDADCAANVEQANASDFPCNTATPLQQYNPGTGYSYSSVVRSLPLLQQTGVVHVYAWAHMRDTIVATCPSAPSDVGGGGGYVVLDVWIIDNDSGQKVAHAVNQSSRIVADLANINVDLVRPLPPNKSGYSVQLQTSWVLYANSEGVVYTGPYQTSYCGWSTIIYAKPVVTNWDITQIY